MLIVIVTSQRLWIWCYLGFLTGNYYCYQAIVQVLFQNAKWPHHWLKSHQVGLGRGSKILTWSHLWYGISCWCYLWQQVEFLMSTLQLMFLCTAVLYQMLADLGYCVYSVYRCSINTFKQGSHTSLKILVIFTHLKGWKVLEYGFDPTKWWKLELCIYSFM